MTDLVTLTIRELSVADPKLTFGSSLNGDYRAGFRCNKAVVDSCGIPAVSHTTQISINLFVVRVQAQQKGRKPLFTVSKLKLPCIYRLFAAIPGQKKKEKDINPT